MSIRPYMDSVRLSLDLQGDMRYMRCLARLDKSIQLGGIIRQYSKMKGHGNG